MCQDSQYETSVHQKYTLTQKQVTTRPNSSGRDIGQHYRKRSKRETTESWEESKRKLEAARAQRGIYDDEDIDDILKNAGRELERRSEPAMLCNAASVKNLLQKLELESTGRLEAIEMNGKGSRGEGSTLNAQ